MTPPPSDHFNGKTFFYPSAPSAGSYLDLLRWKLSSRPARWPDRISLDPSPLPPRPAPHGPALAATWIGHSTYLLQTTHGNFLTDPVFSERTSPVTWAGPRRVHPPGLAFAELPPIDVVLLSHDHYDHCDLPSLRQLAAVHHPLFITPLRHADLLRAAGARQIVELDWWQTHSLAASAGPADVTLTPSRHWSNRLGTPRNHRLWGGFALTLGSHHLWFAGDSGYDQCFGV
jgi:L-ascorbate metabolism protein UlaG (beta-lactamase superfamily)